MKRLISILLAVALAAVARVVAAFPGGSPDIEHSISRMPGFTAVEIMTFMEAADESKRRGGAPVSLREVLEKNSR